MTATGIGANNRSALAPGEGRDELEARREEGMSSDAGDGHETVLERLAKRLQDRT